MIDTIKTFNIDDLFFAMCGSFEIINKKIDNKNSLTKIFKPITYACFKVHTNKDGAIIFKDVLNNSILISDDVNKNYCLLPKSIISAKKLFKNKDFKIIDDNIIKNVIEDLNKAPKQRNPKSYLYNLCELNNIKIIQNEEISKEKI